MSANHRRKLVPVLIVAAGLSLLAYAYTTDNTFDALLGIAAVIFGAASLWAESASDDR